MSKNNRVFVIFFSILLFLTVGMSEKAYAEQISGTVHNELVGTFDKSQTSNRTIEEVDFLENFATEPKKDVIIVAVDYYLRYNLSYREVQELLYDRGINVCHTTIYRWVQEYSKVLYYLWKKKNRQSFYSWKMDETYIKINGRWHYLYRAIDADGLTLDIWLRKKRDTQAAYAFLKRLHKQFGEPKAIVTDKAPSLGSAFRKLQSVGLYTKTEHRTVKYLNNLIEQDHRPIKRRNKFYQSLRTASSTIKGMETIRGIYKKNRRNGTLFGFSVSTEIKVLMGITA
ncbi:IS6 family transposase [Lactiplantibacillus plantarum]|uniref:IS6 family transposase n=1 Tax=Lactiplantibacillus plantarum TaxID=1590 RepID=UPI003C6D9A58